MHHERRAVMLHSVFERAFHEQMRALAGWAIGIAVYCLLMVSVYPTIRDNTSITKLVDSYPKAFRQMFAIYDFGSGPGYLRGEIFSLVGPLLVVILAVLWGSDLIAGEEERGTIDILLANPVSRRRLCLEKWAAMTLGVAGVSAVFAVVLLAVGPAAELHVGVDPLIAATLATALLGIMFGTTALAISAGTGRRGLARGVTAALAVAAYLVSSLSGLVGWLGPVRPASPWYHALGVDPLANGLSWHPLVLVALTLALLVLSVTAFERRDLAVS